MTELAWPYPNEMDREERLSADVLVLGGGMAGCYAAIAAARKGRSVILVEKGATVRSGAAGSGFDHWESACTNPCSRVTAEEIANAYIHEQDGYSNGIAHYIECQEGWHRLKDMETFGGKSAMRRASLRGRISGTRRRASCSPTTMKINLRSACGAPPSSRRYIRVEAPGRAGHRPDGSHGASGKAGKGKNASPEPWA